MGAFSQKELEYLREQGTGGSARGYIATVSRKQIPQLTPVGFVADEERIYLNIKYDSVKARNIRRNPRVSFVVDDRSIDLGRRPSSSHRQSMISLESGFIIRMLYLEFFRWDE